MARRSRARRAPAPARSPSATPSSACSTRSCSASSRPTRRSVSISAMPPAPRSTSSRRPRPALIAALSGRALAAAASRAGERAVVLDLFADRDTARHAQACVAVPRGPHGFARDAILAAVARLAGEVRGLVYGAGFEHDPALLGEIMRLVPLRGNLPKTAPAGSDPLGFAALLPPPRPPPPPTPPAPPRRHGRPS